MKNQSSLRMFICALCALLLTLVVACQPALAQAAGDGATATSSSSILTDSGFIGAVIAAIMAVVAIWQNKEKKTAQKVSESLVQAIEVATKIPAVAEKEKAIKKSISDTVADLGVGPLVHRIVKDVTV